MIAVFEQHLSRQSPYYSQKVSKIFSLLQRQFFPNLYSSFLIYQQVYLMWFKLVQASQKNIFFHHFDNIRNSCIIIMKMIFFFFSLQLTTHLHNNQYQYIAWCYTSIFTIIEKLIDDSATSKLIQFSFFFHVASLHFVSCSAYIFTTKHKDTTRLFSVILSIKCCGMILHITKDINLWFNFIL